MQIIKKVLLLEIPELKQFMDRLGSIYGAHNQNGALMTWRIFGCISFGLLIIIMQINGMIHIWPNFLKICNSSIIESIVVQLIVRVSNRFIRNDEKIVQRIQKHINNFYRREEQNIQNRLILNSFLKNIELGLKAYCVLGLIPFCAPSVSALVSSIVSREYFLFVPFRIPFTDPENSLTEFIVHSTVLFIGSLLNGIILISGDAFFLYFILQTIPMINMLKIKFRAFGFDVLNFHEQKKINIDQLPSTSRQEIAMKKKMYDQWISTRRKLESRLIDIIRECQEYDEYVKLCHLYMEMTIFVAILMNSFSIGLAILIAYSSSYTIGISAFLIFFIEILILCLLGSIVIYQNEKLLNELCSFPWYELSVPTRKIFLQTIHMCQNLTYLEIPIFGNLGMELFTRILNEAYAYLMFILNFVH